MGKLYDKGGRLCRNGHVKEGDNLYIDRDGHRICRACDRLRRNEYYWRGKEMEYNLKRDFTSRERDVWRLTAIGLDNNEIARTLTLQMGTVQNVLNTLYSKTGLEGNSQSKRIRLMRLYKEPVNANS